MSNKYTVPSIVGTQLRFNIASPKDLQADVEVIDFEEVFNLLEEAKTDPVFVLKTVLKLKMGLDRIYLHYRDHYEEAKAELKSFEAEQTTRFSQKDPSNPHYGSMRLTKDAVAAAVEALPEYAKRREELQVLGSYKSEIHLVKTIVGDLFSVVKILVTYTLNSAANGEEAVVDTSEISRLAKRLGNVGGYVDHDSGDDDESED